MSVRRTVIYAGLTFSLASLAFSLGSWTSQRHIEQEIARNDARLTELRDDLARSILRQRAVQPVASGTTGERQPDVVAAAGDSRSAIVDEVKRQLQAEMGLFPLQLLREKRRGNRDEDADRQERTDPQGHGGDSDAGGWRHKS